MTRFTITCFCRKTNLKFRSLANYSAEIITRLYCPKCVDRAPEEALLIRVFKTPKNDGLYALDWNQGVLKYLDPKFRDQESWYANFFGKKKLIFDFLPNKKPERFYEIVGQKKDFALQELTTYKRLESEKPTKLPKKKRKGPKESYRPFFGYKGHR